MEPLLPTDAQGNFGKTSIKYEVRFTEDGLPSLFAQPFNDVDEWYVRRSMRLIVLANYLNKQDNFKRVGWCYWTSRIRTIWAKEKLNFTTHSSYRFDPIDPSPLKNLEAPPFVTATNDDLGQLNVLYQIEESAVKGFRKLSELIQSKQKLNARDFEKALGDFASALQSYDSWDKGDNSIFAVLDKLLHRYATSKPYRNSSLELKSTVNGRTTTKMLVA